MKDCQVATFWGIDEVFLPFLTNSPQGTQFPRDFFFFHAESCISPTLVNIYDENNDKIYCLEMKISIPHTQFVHGALVQPQSKWS